jgi:hypothetical protein
MKRGLRCMWSPKRTVRVQRCVPVQAKVVQRENTCHVGIPVAAPGLLEYIPSFSCLLDPVEKTV